MGLQLIFVVETNKKCKSDWIYIKDTIDRFYQYDQTRVKFSPVYMDGKGKYKNKEKEICGLISQYAVGNKTNQSKVIFCFDCDDYDSKPEDAEFLANAKRYCTEKKYDFIWFCTCQQILDTKYKKIVSYIVRLYTPYATLDITPRNAGQVIPTA